MNTKFTFGIKYVKVLFLILAFILIRTSYGQSIINIDSTHQHISGFGAANILSWRPDMTDSEIETAFGTEDRQLGFTILRLRIPNRESNFSVNLPTAQKVHQRGITLMASPWSPPAEMKTNGSTTGGELKESSYEDFANYLNKFTDYMAENGAPIYAVSVQNEPDIAVSYESCDYTPDQMFKFVKENGHIIKSKLMGPESYKFDKGMSDLILNDELATENCDIICGHIYGGGRSKYPLAKEKGKEVWMTEYLVNTNMNGSNMDTSWASAIYTAKSIHDCMLADMSAYIWWYIVRYYGPICDGTMGRKGEVTKKGYAMSNYSRFIRHGYFRVECPKILERDVYMSAYTDSSLSKLVIVVINKTSGTIEQDIQIPNASADKFNSYVTTKSKNCELGDAYQVVDGNISLKLEPSSITTFVSEGLNVDVDEQELILPTEFELYQNYPNPFNPSTKIKFSIAKKSDVKITIYDILGREVAVLLNNNISVGVHEIEWDAANLTSGIYYCRMVSGNFVQSNKMMLIK